MSQAEEQWTDKQETDETFSEREKSIGNKLWGVYISEAQKYDQGLIDGWRSEMDGLLIFAGLFSGVVTTFIIDSYKTLNPDLGNQTLAMLTQISHQLASLNNGTAVTDPLPSPTAFSPPLSSLICNALWFTSLALSLSCALVATLVEQWAREYQHRTTMFSSPSVRARVYMYLYYGLRRFNMHAVVGIPPVLLHGALVLFFAGLVAFLVPVNNIIMGISSALLLLFVSVYGTFTALPLFFLDCPYQTPLTRILWSLNQSLGSVLRAYIWRAAAICRAFYRKRRGVTDPEKATEYSVTNTEASADGRPQSQSMVHALKSEALRSTVETETRALAWTVRSLSDDEELEPFVEGLPQTLWDFENSKPRSVYQAHFQRLLRNPQVHLCQRLVDFMAGSNSNLLEPKDRVRRQLSVLRAIWAICAFSLHTGSPLQSPIGEADVRNALLGSKFIDSPDVQSMVLDVTALIRLNTTKSRSQDRASTQKCDSDAAAKGERQTEMLRTYLDYLLALSQCAASFQREATHSLFDRSQMLFTEADGYRTLRDVLKELIKYASDKAANKTADNLVFSARLIITLFAQTSKYSYVSLRGLARFLVRHPSVAASDPKLDSEHHYTRYLFHDLCRNLRSRTNPQESVDALELIYRELFQSDVPPRDFDTHLFVLCTLRTEAADIRTHRLAAIVQSVVLKSFKKDLSASENLPEWEQLPSIFVDKAWFRAVIGLDNEKRTGRASARKIYHCTYVGLVTTFLEQGTAGNPDQTEHDLNLATLKEVCVYIPVSSVIPTGLQRRFADAAAGFIRKHPANCLADGTEVYAVLHWAIDEDNGWIKDSDALRILDTAVSEVQKDNQQQSHRDRAQRIREQMKDRLLLPEIIYAAFVSLATELKDVIDAYDLAVWCDITLARFDMTAINETSTESDPIR
ncbi:unnamed protein product [Mycena citricolor]|uniref:DUF6535 domain-containing protein n=2 Tax=Mycena citricolor TaxID=2018698 RepID=A0AAD2HM76_9AGAR|nr:unnamed protein product [Mycena citricolor]